jgi:hypothetical protein
MKGLLANALGYQAVWFAAVLGAAQGLAWPGVVAALAFVALQPPGPRGRRGDAALMLGALACGLVVDSALVSSGRIVYAAHDAGWPAPAWILAVWIAFAATLERSLRFLRDRPWLAAALGGIAGPLAWLAAARLGAVVFVGPPAVALCALAVAWAVVLPALYALSRLRTAPAPQPTGGAR